MAHPFASFAKGWGIARSATAFLLLTGATLLFAQSSSCGLTSIKEESQLVYPPIARAAHVSGTVILLAQFNGIGLPVHVSVVNGPPMLQPAAVEFVKSWRANEYTGPRECPIVVHFEMTDGDKPVCSYEEAGAAQLRRADFQHVSISVRPISTCDPAATITRKKHFLFF